MKKVSVFIFVFSCAIGLSTIASQASTFAPMPGSDSKPGFTIQKRLSSFGYNPSRSKAHSGSVPKPVIQTFPEQAGFLESSKVNQKAPAVSILSAEPKQPELAQSDAAVEADAEPEPSMQEQAELEQLARVIYSEARGESFEGQVAIGAVVLNRVESDRFPDSIGEVIFQRGQFTAVMDGQYYLTPNTTAYAAAKAALNGSDPTNGALYYYNPRTATSSWSKKRPSKITIDRHVFTH
ncbi:MAG: spore cortex-lytic protein [Paenibacillus sp.]|nr:spore cortex-lytic protein [Paenibacillus sp.]